MHAASSNTHSHHSLTTTLVCVTGCGVDQKHQCAIRQTLGMALFVEILAQSKLTMVHRGREGNKVISILQECRVCM